MSYPSSRFKPASRDVFPYVWIENERKIPSPIFVAGFVGVARLKSFQLPEEWRDELWQLKLPEVKTRLREYLEDHSETPAFGQITGFRLVWSPNKQIRLDREGNPIEIVNEPMIWPVAVLRV